MINDYDLLGRRISRTYNSITTTYVWDGAHIIAEYTDSSLTKKYIYGPGMDNSVAMVNVSGQTETWYYYYTDNLGSVRLLTDGGGTIKESYAYDPYGQPYVMNAAGDGNWLTEDVTTYSSSHQNYGNSYMFTARRWDSDTELYYYRFRDYAPELGRFVQTDPAGYIDTMNLYAYCGNNPVNWIDPWGLDKEGNQPPMIAPALAIIGGITICVGPTAPVVWVGVGLVYISAPVAVGEALLSGHNSSAPPPPPTGQIKITPTGEYHIPSGSNNPGDIFKSPYGPWF